MQQVQELREGWPSLSSSTQLSLLPSRSRRPTAAEVASGKFVEQFLCLGHQTMSVEGITFSRWPVGTFICCCICSFVCSSIHLDIYCYHNFSWTPWTNLIKLTDNLHFPLTMTWLDSEGQRHRRASRWRSRLCRRWGIRVLRLVFGRGDRVLFPF